MDGSAEQCVGPIGGKVGASSCEVKNIFQLMFVFFVFLLFLFVCPLQRTLTNRPGLRRL